MKKKVEGVRNTERNSTEVQEDKHKRNLYQENKRKASKQARKQTNKHPTNNYKEHISCPGMKG